MIRRLGNVWKLASHLLAAALALSGARALPSDFFGGPSTGLMIQPEVDAILHTGSDARLILTLMPTIIPSRSYGEMGVGLYGAWVVAPIRRHALSPDIAKRRTLDTRLGVEWYPALQPGALGWSNVLYAEAEATPRLLLPGDLLATVRNRFEARWQLAEPASFGWRLRFRPGLEREFALSDIDRLSLTPYANVEFIWATNQGMWDQFRMQAGLQLGAQWFGKGQIIEVNASVWTYLQPSRSYSPIVGVVWTQFF